MKLNELLLAEYDREVARSRKVLEQMPEGKREWKPHERSMELGYLAELVATMPTWVALTINRDELDIAPKDGSQFKRAPLETRDDYLKAQAKASAEGRTALQGATEDHLLKPWRLLQGGTVVVDTTRHEMVSDTLNHLVHHRGQMTVYLRLLGAKVPALYGPSADDKTFA